MERTGIDENFKRMMKCPKFAKCNVNVCPLDEFVESRSHTQKDKICPYFLNWLEGKEVPDFIEEAIKEREEILRKKYGESTLKNRLKARQSVRKHFNPKERRTK